MAEKRKVKKTGLSLAFWLLVTLVVLIIFLVKKDDIFSNIKKTEFMDKVFGKTPEFVQNYPDKSEVKEEKLTEDIVIEITPKTTPASTPKADTEKAPKVEAIDDEPITAKPIVEEKKVEKIQEVVPVETPKAKTDLTLCFVTIDANGSVSRKMVTRSVAKTDSPLTEAIRQVLAGPLSMNSSEKDCMSLIPEGSRLLGASVKDGVAYLNFNEAFQINNMGAEGYDAQLMQIVYTATAFSTVKSVQFLFDGEKMDFFGGDGRWVGSPLSRGSF